MANTAELEITFDVLELLTLVRGWIKRRDSIDSSVDLRGSRNSSCEGSYVRCNIAKREGSDHDGQ